MLLSAVVPWWGHIEHGLDKKLKLEGGKKWPTEEAKL